ncbi:hypothetical protein [Kribbella italica]|uniref:Uncharacterized protein n=1 Tax=Kribbella italica TaxID=1540520 RepID=A0A7W9JCJ8_9ACTN|nr:hypothetical protein [Kribbella italica]MBB5839661.1 hypothetical protein [Kribbella italica]
MNDHDFGDDLRDALRPDDGIRPLDPATVIAGAHRRRRMRGLAAAGLASVAVLAIAAGGLLASGSPTGTAPAPAAPPTTGTTGVRPGTPTPPGTPSAPTPPANFPDATPSGQISAGRTIVPNTPLTAADLPTLSTDNPAKPNASRGAAFAAQCRTALLAQDPGPGPAATKRATLEDRDGITMILADSTRWGACDNGYDSPEVTLRQPASMQRPSRDNLQALAVANNRVTRNGQDYEYYWAAGLLPKSVAGLRYTFPDGATVNATVTGGFWLMKHRSATPGGGPPGAPPIKVELLAQDGSVLVTRELEWGLHTCAQISHGC